MLSIAPSAIFVALRVIPKMTEDIHRELDARMTCPTLNLLRVGACSIHKETAAWRSACIPNAASSRFLVMIYCSPNAAGNVKIYQNIDQRLWLPLMKSAGTCRS
jgi:hypothetical protein